MIIKCSDNDFETIYEIINDGASAYQGIIPNDRWHSPYMSKSELKDQISDGVEFWGYQENHLLIGIMGLQSVSDLTLIRHAYIKTIHRNKGIGSILLNHLSSLTNKPILIGTWADALWAISFYQKQGFQLLNIEEKNRVLKKYWKIPERQIETSVVLGNDKWFTNKKETN